MLQNSFFKTLSVNVLSFFPFSLACSSKTCREIEEEEGGIPQATGTSYAPYEWLS